MTTEVKSALIRRRTAGDWRERLEVLTDEHLQAARKVREALEIAADAVAELQACAMAPATEAPLYFRTGRPLPFRPGLILEDFKSALRRRGVAVEEPRRKVRCRA